MRDPDLEQIEARVSFYRQQVFRKHTHKAYAVGLVRQGATDFWYENRTRTVRAGDIALINPEGVHACNPRPGGVLTYCMFYIETDLMQRIARGVFDQDGELPRFAQPVVQDPHLWQAFTNLYTLMLRSEDRLEKQANLYETLSELMSGYTTRRAPPVPSDDCPEPLHSVQEYLVQNIAHNISLEELAALANLSPYHFLRRFRTVFGMPPHTYRLQQRIHFAKRMLADGTPIAQVASDTGFTDQSHFTKRFKAFVGATPRQYQLASR